ncbi:MAG: isoprenylcysteine carboxylmethyltransferase family protein [candidate division Zixibacteria bacterium]|nr:isoprenylcysteine carboxylmethyltransferase family protein [candidate division Zixibacteria bacterium]
MTPLLKTLIFLLLVPVTGVILIPRWILLSGWNRTFEIGNWNLLGAPLIALGAAGLLWCFWDFATFGKGTPAPIDPPKVFVSRGLYRWVRNPMYVGIALILSGEALFFESWSLFGLAAFVWFAQHLFVLLYEEPVLKQKFGAEYEAYLKTVPRWLPKRPK